MLIAVPDERVFAGGRSADSELLLPRDARVSALFYARELSELQLQPGWQVRPEGSGRPIPRPVHRFANDPVVPR